MVSNKKKNKGKRKRKESTELLEKTQNTSVQDDHAHKQKRKSDVKRSLTEETDHSPLSSSDSREPKTNEPSDFDPPENDSNESTMDKENSPQQEQEVLPSPHSFTSIQPPLSSCTLDAIKDLNFSRMTPVQKAVIPLFLTNKDVSVQAVTGSGKTCAFIIPMIEMILRLENILKPTEIGGLVISPTRELARQTYDVACHFCQYAKCPPPILLVGGSRSVLDDLSKFQKLKSDIAIATPGRLEDIMTRYDVFQFRELECLVLDEADVLLDMGFDITLTSILRKLPKMRRTGLFSATTATASKGLKSLVRAGLRNPVTIQVIVHDKSNSQETLLKEVSQRATPVTLTNYYSLCKLTTKLNQLVHFLKLQLSKKQKCICFFYSCAHVEFYQVILSHILNEGRSKDEKYYMEALHGKKVQKRREKTMERFRQVSTGVLLCTDIAARGLDISDVHWVIQFDAPTDPASFVHRVGRSARAGKRGKSVIFLTRKEESYIDFLGRRKIPLTMLPVEEGGVGKLNEDGDNSDEESVEHQNEVELTDVLPRVKKLVLKDRDVLEKGTKAFTAHIRAYKEHQCAFIFRFASLNLGQLATSFALLRLPKMPELRPHLHSKLDFTPADPSINIHAIPYLDRQREAARQKRLAQELAAGGKNAKQIKAEQRIADRLRREKEKRLEAKRRGLRDPEKKRKGRNQQLMEEWDELAKEERLHKKLKRGKITREEYGILMYGDVKKEETSDGE